MEVIVLEETGNALVTSEVSTEELVKAICAYSTKMDVQNLSEVALKLNRGKESSDRIISLFLLQMLADQNPECLSALGDRYYLGNCLHTDKDMAMQIFRQAAKQGSERSAYDLGWYYYDQHEYMQAAEYFEKCIHTTGALTDHQIGNSHACLGNCYMNMSDQKYSKGFEHLCIAADKYHNAYADRLLAFIYADEEKSYFDPKKSLLHYRKAAKNGDELAAFELGKYYIYGSKPLKIEKSRSSAEEILIDYESTKNPDLLRIIGLMYLNLPKEDMINQEMERACTYLQRAAEYSDSGCIAGDIGYAYYRLGRYTEAEKMLLKANESGYCFYSDFLGRIYRDGLLGEKDLQKAKIYYESAYRSESLNNLFTCSEYAELLIELCEYEKAYEVAHYGDERYKDIWFVFIKCDLVLKKRILNRITIEEALIGLQACIGMNTCVKDAYMSLGLYYLETRDYRKSEEHLSKAFAAGAADAGVYLGRLYENGGGTINPNDQLAHEWFDKAAKQGSELGKKELECWKKKLFGGYRRVRRFSDGS